MSWNYRIIHHDTVSHPYFAMHEVYYDEHGKIGGWTAEPVDVSAEHNADIVLMLKQMLTDSIVNVLIESELERDIAWAKLPSDS